MEKENKKINITFDGFISFIGVVVLVLAIGLSVVYYGMRMDDSVTVTADCEVVDKYYVGNGRYRSYHAVLSYLDGTKQITKEIDVNEDSYWEGLQVGDWLPCEVIFDEIGIVEITVLDENVEQYTAAENRKGFLIGLGIFTGVLVFIFGLIFLICRNDGEEEETPVNVEPKDHALDKRYLPRYRVTLRPGESEDDEPRDLIIIETVGRNPEDAKDNAEYWLDPDIDFEVVDIVDVFEG